jgi:arylsulfatase A-like enzyme
MDNNPFNRRDFLKLLSMMPAAYYLPSMTINQESVQENFVILVLDAWSAANMSLYGYPRQTTPFLEKLTEKAIVYHNHYAASNWTFPGTSGLLTGVHNWTNRMHNQNRPFNKAFRNINLFSLFSSHHRISYTQNMIADIILKNMLSGIDNYTPPLDLYLKSDPWLRQIFGNDYDIATVSWTRIAKKYLDGYANSLFLSRLYKEINREALKKIQAVEQDYPLGLPAAAGDNYYNLENPIDWISAQLPELPQPFLSYFHLLPPHGPYSTRCDFYNTFLDDGFQPTHKPEHIFSLKYSDEELAAYRKDYDEFILLVDSEINRLYQILDKNNILENTWLIITSDHGEMFERGIVAHSIPTFHNPLVHIPLLIFPPGQEKRIDITTPTSAIDLLPTLLHLAGNPIPDWLEGQLLPPYNTAPDPERDIFSMDAKYSPDTGPFTNATLMLRKGDYKLTYFFGDQKKYTALIGKEFFELYNLENDPEELENLYNKEPGIAATLTDKLIAKLEEKEVR